MASKGKSKAALRTQSYPGEPYRAPYLEQVAKTLESDLENEIPDGVPAEMDEIMCMFETFENSTEWQRRNCAQFQLSEEEQAANAQAEADRIAAEEQAEADRIAAEAEEAARIAEEEAAAAAAEAEEAARIAAEAEEAARIAEEEAAAAAAAAAAEAEEAARIAEEEAAAAAAQAEADRLAEEAAARLALVQYQYQTVAKANSWSNFEDRDDAYLARCRCTSEDYSLGLSICMTGSCSPTEVIDDTFGCTYENRGCDDGKCNGNPFEYDSNTMTYDECEYQCERIGLVVLNSDDASTAAINTGCGTDSQETWAYKYELPCLLGEYDDGNGNCYACSASCSNGCTGPAASSCL